MREALLKDAGLIVANQSTGQTLATKPIGQPIDLAA
jgi:hypothetical protein